MQILIQKIADEVKKRMEGEGTGHDWPHVERVWKKAIKIQEKEGGDITIISLAALLHDVGDFKITGSHDTALKIPEEIMKKFEVDDNLLSKVLECVKTVSYSANLKPSSLEGEIVQDADRIEALGAIGIARAFAYGGAKGRPLWDPQEKLLGEFKNKEEYYAHQSSSLNHIIDKGFRIIKLINTKAGMAMAKEGDEYIHEFYQRFKDEWEGNI